MFYSKYRQVLDNFELVQVEAHGGNKVKRIGMLRNWFVHYL